MTGILKRLSPLVAPLMVFSILLPTGQGISHAKEPVRESTKSKPKPSPKPSISLDYRDREQAASRSKYRVALSRVGTPTGNKNFAKLYVAQSYNWTGQQFVCLGNLWTRESGWSHKAHNRSSGAHGIPQSLPGSKMAKFGKDWYSNPVTQIKWGANYIDKRYGNPCNAWAHSQRTGWY